MRFVLVAGSLVVSSSVACVVQNDDAASSETLGEVVSQPIVGGTTASAYTEAALINTPSFICSGSLIAPKVVLTAGHCVTDTNTFSIVAPFANRQSARGVSKWTEYTQTGEYVNPNKSDVAVIVLDRAIDLPAYPKLAQSAVPAGTKVVNVGRIDDGVASNTALFFGKEVTVRNGSVYGFPLSYVSEEVIQSGASGGPVYLAGNASPRTIVAVNSGGGGGTQVLARVDLVYAKIQEIIAQSGGATATPSPPAPACSGTAETEPNDASNQADALAGTACGALATGGDVDWYAWSSAVAGTGYEVALAATGDADILMWKWNGGAWARVQNTSPTRIAAATSSAGKYLVAVRSAGGAAQSYALKLTR